VLSEELSEVELFSEDLVVIVDRQHEIAKTKESISLAQLAQYELLLPLSGTPIRREIDEASREQGVELNPLIEVDGLRTIASMTFDGLGPTILPASMLPTHMRDTFVAVHITNLRRRRALLAGRRFGFPAAPVRAIHALLLDVVKKAVNVPDGVYIPSD
jgi:DNA-binding transcriptional LysR family regulator